MMLQIDHRESRDVDIFLYDPQLLQFLDPRKHDFQFEILSDAYGGDGTKTVKIAFTKIGEIDFIVAGAMTTLPTTAGTIDGEIVLLETIPEIITKKIYHRAAALKPRDIFGIAAAAGQQCAERVIEALRSYPDQVAQALATMEKLNPDFVYLAIAQLAIRDRYKTIAKTAIAKSIEILRAV